MKTAIGQITGYTLTGFIIGIMMMASGLETGSPGMLVLWTIAWPIMIAWTIIRMFGIFIVIMIVLLMIWRKRKILSNEGIG